MSNLGGKVKHLGFTSSKSQLPYVCILLARDELLTKSEERLRAKNMSVKDTI